MIIKQLKLDLVNCHSRIITGAETNKTVRLSKNTRKNNRQI